MLYIEPGSPWENGYAESFFSRLRDELLNCEEFANLTEARWGASGLVDSMSAYFWVDFKGSKRTIKGTQLNLLPSAFLGGVECTRSLFP